MKNHLLGVIENSLSYIEGNIPILLETIQSLYFITELLEETHTHTSWNWATSVDLLYSLLWPTVLYKHVICCYELEEQICIPSSHIIVYICHGRSVILIVCTQTLRDIVLGYRSVCSKLERNFYCVSPDTGEKIGKPQAYNCSM